jgi:hybrid cluster-associated redox disulfide protein
MRWRSDMQEQQVITAEMSIGDVINKYPDTIQVFFKHGLGCVGCAVAGFENIRQGAMAHGVDVDLLMKDLNQAILQA